MKPCEKKPFSTQHEARQFAKRLLKKYPGEARQYDCRCTYCGSYHLSRQRPVEDIRKEELHHEARYWINRNNWRKTLKYDNHQCGRLSKKSRG